MATGTRFYFATPHNSWERGTNENTIGLIRQHLPKGTSMKHLSQARCDEIARHLNDRPRSGWDSRLRRSATLPASYRCDSKLMSGGGTNRAINDQLAVDVIAGESADDALHRER